MKKTIVLLLFAPPVLFSQSTLFVHVHNVVSSQGEIKVAIYDSDKTFLKFEGMAKSGSTKAEMGTVTLKIRDIPNGEYALAVFHDANGNDELDTNWLGVPKEKVAFSKAKMRPFGPPKYRDCAFTVSKDRKIDIYL